METEDARDMRDEGLVLGLALFLDLPEDVRDRWLDYERVISLSPSLSLTLVRLFEEAADSAGVSHDDEAARAVERLLICGVDRQAFIADMIQSLLTTQPELLGEPDPMKGYNARATGDRLERQRYAQMGRAAQVDPEPEELDSASIVSACEELFGTDAG